jgi:hypothetical protein
MTVRLRLRCAIWPVRLYDRVDAICRRTDALLTLQLTVVTARRFWA